MKELLINLNSLLNQEDGQGMVEYGLVIALVALFAIGAFTVLGGNIDTLIRGISF